LRREAIEIAVVEEAQTVAAEAFNHDEIVVNVNEVQEQTKAVAVLSDIHTADGVRETQLFHTWFF
jgi:hypothetical protein